MNHTDRSPRRIAIKKHRPWFPDLRPLRSQGSPPAQSWKPRRRFYATLVATRSTFPIAEQQSLALGALLVHDLDLIGDPTSPTVLNMDSDPQFHRPDLGARMGRAIELSADAVQIIALHHERSRRTAAPWLTEAPRLARSHCRHHTAFDDLTAKSPERTSLPITSPATDRTTAAPPSIPR